MADVEGLEASRIELDAGGPSYTADTLATLLAEDPVAGAVRDPRRRRRRRACSPGSGGRRCATSPRSSWWSARRGSAPTAPAGWRWIQVEVPRLEVSSTDLRARAVDGRPLDYLVTHEVADWIEAHGLYRR